MELKTGYETIQVSDGTSMRAYVAQPATPANRGLIVGQEAFGVNAHIRDVTERFARQGFIAVAPELFHRTGPGFEGRYDNFAEAAPHMRALTDAGMGADLRSTFDWLFANRAPEFPIATVGFCMGGRAAVLTALVAPVKCAASFYGGGIAPNANNPGLLDRLKDLHAPLLLFWGGKDKHITPDQTRAVADRLRTEGKTFVTVELSDADHGFFCDARPSYHAAAAAESWALVLAFLDTYTIKRDHGKDAY